MVKNGNCIHSPSLLSSMNFRECSKFDNLHYFREEKKRLFLVFHLLPLVSSFGDETILNPKHITTVLASAASCDWLHLSLGFTILVKYIYFPLIFMQCNMQPDCLFVCSPEYLGQKSIHAFKWYSRFIEDRSINSGSGSFCREWMFFSWLRGFSTSTPVSHHYMQYITTVKCFTCIW